MSRRVLKRFEGRTVLVVGALRGIGAAHARGFHSEGACVVIGDIHDSEGHALANEMGDRCLFVHMDPDCPGDWDRTMAVAEKHFGTVTMVINSAGVSDRAERNGDRRTSPSS
jgi:3alpha(or 20beta)-hydroxysteroid dehydrogenase